MEASPEPLPIDTLAVRLGWTDELGNDRAIDAARIVARTLQRRGLLRVSGGVNGLLVVEAVNHD